MQDQQIRELARYADLTAARIRSHDTQIYRLQYKLLVVEDGIKEMIDVSNFQVYTSHHVSIAQYYPGYKQELLALRTILTRFLSI